MTSFMDSVELPKLPENQKSFAGIPEAVFVVSLKIIIYNLTFKAWNYYDSIFFFICTLLLYFFF